MPTRQEAVRYRIRECVDSGPVCVQTFGDARREAVVCDGPNRGDEIAQAMESQENSPARERQQNRVAIVGPGKAEREGQAIRPVAANQKKQTQSQKECGGRIEKHRAQRLADQQCSNERRKRLLGSIREKVQRFE